MANQNDVMIRDRGGRFGGQADLTDQQAAFVDAYLTNGGLTREAAEAAEYAYPAIAGWKLLGNARIVQAIEREQTRRLVAASALAEQELKRILGKPERDIATERLKIAAANALFKRINQVQSSELDDADARARARARSLATADLERYIAELRAREAKTIDVSPSKD